MTQVYVPEGKPYARIKLYPTRPTNIKIINLPRLEPINLTAKVCSEGNAEVILNGEVIPAIVTIEEDNGCLEGPLITHTKRTARPARVRSEKKQQ